MQYKNLCLKTFLVQDWNSFVSALNSRFLMLLNVDDFANFMEGGCIL